MERVNSTLGDQTQVKKSEIYLTKTLEFKNFICGVIFLVYMLVNLVMCVVSVFNGHFNQIGLTVSQGGDVCGQGSMTGYPYLYYTKPCDGQVGTKICVISCPNASSPSLESLATFSSYSPFSVVINCSSDCSVYDSYYYLSKICVPTQAGNSVELMLRTQELPILLDSLSLSYRQILLLAAAILGICLVVYLIQAFFPSIIYTLIGCSFVGMLFLAFFILKVSEIRSTQLLQTLDPESMPVLDEKKQAFLSYLLFAIYFICLPLIMILKERLNKALVIIRLLKGILLSSLSLHLFTLSSLATIYAQFILEIFALVNLYTNNSAESSSYPFYTYSGRVSNPASQAFMYLGFVWLVSFTISYHQFVVCSYTSIWYAQEDEETPAFNPLTRSLIRSYYNFGAIALDSIMFPFSWIMLLLWSVSKPSVRTQNPSDQQNGCTKFLNESNLKIRKIIHMGYQVLNKGAFCSMAISNRGYLQSCKEYAEVQSHFYNKCHGFGTIVGIYTGLFVTTSGMLISYFVLYFEVLSVSTPSSVSSLSIPLVILFLLAVSVSNIVAGTLGYALDTSIFCCLLAGDKPGPLMKAYLVSEAVEEF